MKGRCRPSIFVFAGLGLLCCSAAAVAGETISYSYDAEGRLIKVGRSGTVNNGVHVNFLYDRADNRLNVTSGSGTTTTLVASDAVATEGGTLSFRILRHGNVSGSTSVNYASSSGTATSGSDFTSTSGSVTFAANEIEKLVTVSTTDDSSSESSETMNLALSGATGGAAIGRTPGIGTIDDNDAPLPCASVSFAVNDQTVTEGQALVFTVSKAGTATASCSVSYATANGTAQAGTNYVAKSGTLNFALNQTTATISVATIDQQMPPNGFGLKMYLNLSAPSDGASLNDSQGIGTIHGSCTSSCNSAAPPPDPEEL